MPAKPPNMVIFMPDELRWDCVGYTGNNVIQTPNVDRLAGEGTGFNHFYVNHTVCSPSRVCMFTGWYPHVRGHRTLWHLLQPDEPNVFRYLKEAGYHVEMWGKNHLLADASVESSISFRGTVDYDRERGIDNNPIDPDDKWFRTMYYGERPSKVSNDWDRQWVDGALEFLNSKPPEPFCLFLPLFFPHPPYWVEEPYFSMYDRKSVPTPSPAEYAGKPKYYPEIHHSRDLDKFTPDELREIVATYYGMVSRIDDQFGEVIGALENNGFWDSTATFFFSDHGDYVGDYGLTEKWPSGLEDCLARVPLAIRIPGADPQPITDALAETIDLTPTILDLAGIDIAHDQFGKSLLPLIRGETTGHKDAVFAEGGHRPQEHQSLELVDDDADPNYVYYPKGRSQTDDPSAVCKAAMVRTLDWKYISRLDDTDELYDMQNDPGEMVNLVDRPEHAAIQTELHDRLLRWFLETGDVVPWEKDEAGRPAND
ncbi:MAG: arylsulfatase [Gemmatimonadaceae bacterium]|nr:arylsulfatase [Gemmatimonadaceae bacterium]